MVNGDYNILIENGLDMLMENSIKELLRTDEIYNKDVEDEDELEKKYMHLKISKEDKRLIDDYIACIESTADHYSQVAYVAGIKDTITLLSSLNLIGKQQE